VITIQSLNGRRRAGAARTGTFAEPSPAAFPRPKPTAASAQPAVTTGTAAIFTAGREAA